MRRRELPSKRGHKERSVKSKAPESSSGEKGQDLLSRIGRPSGIEGGKRGPNGRGVGGVLSSGERARENAQGKKKGAME